ncbi:MAG TPA: hypothetical protein VN158_09310 [Caulobacter sp.]|nr:hypothetical protein [Caulobacter sp.]
MSISSIGSSSSAGAYGGVSALPVGEPSAKDEFLKFQAMTPAQKMRAMMLAKLGLTEDEVKAMSPEDRKKVEDKLKEMIKQQVQDDPERKDHKGLVANIMA